MTQSMTQTRAANIRNDASDGGGGGPASTSPHVGPRCATLATCGVRRPHLAPRPSVAFGPTRVNVANVAYLLPIPPVVGAVCAIIHNFLSLPSGSEFQELEHFLHLTLDNLVLGVDLGCNRCLRAGLAAPAVPQEGFEHLVTQDDQCGP